MEISYTEENYLKAIYSISIAGGEGEATTNRLSEHLNNKAASVTDMLKRLAEKKLINYRRYRGVELTSKGERVALKIIRKHRLWEVFLLEKLKFTWDEVHDIAEQLEHIQSDELMNRLDEFLGKPKFDPHGDPIPDSNGNFYQTKARPLSQFSKKGSFVFTGVGEHSKAFLQYLSSIGLKIGDVLRVQSVNAFDHSYMVRTHKVPLFLSSQVASNILVEVKK
jgi:DtxR family Mn-dependent transcriptional regulator